jgi:hypothetical protein
MTSSNTIPYQGEMRIAFLVAILYYGIVSLVGFSPHVPASWILPMVLAALFVFTAWRTWYTRTRLGWTLSKIHSGITIAVILLGGVLAHFLDGLESRVAADVMTFTYAMIPISWQLKKPIGAVSDQRVDMVDFIVIGVLFTLFGSWGMVASWNQSATIIPWMSFWFASVGAVLIVCSRAIVRVGSEYEPFMNGISWCAFAKPVLLVSLVPFSFFLLPVLKGEDARVLSEPLHVALLTVATVIMVSSYLVPFGYDWYRLTETEQKDGSV